jgi:hypothetical protein
LLRKKDTIPAGTINLLTSKVTEASEQNKEKRFRFDLITPNRTYKIFAETQIEANAWMESIKSAIVVSLCNNNPAN